MEITTFEEFVKKTGIIIHKRYFDILKYIHNQGVVNFKDIRNELGVVKKTVSNRVKVLEKLGLVEIHKKGRDKLVKIKKETQGNCLE